MSKEALVNQINDQFNSKAEAERAIDRVMGGVEALLRQRQTVAIKGFGVFKVKSQPARKMRNPRTQETIEVAAKDVVKFAGKFTL
jgi:DNA-binding protein HU-beta